MASRSILGKWTLDPPLNNARYPTIASPAHLTHNCDRICDEKVIAFVIQTLDQINFTRASTLTSDCLLTSDVDLSSFFCLHIWVPNHSIGFRRDADQQAIGTTPRAGIVGTTPRIQVTPILPHQISSHSALWELPPHALMVRQGIDVPWRA